MNVPRHINFKQIACQLGTEPFIDLFDGTVFKNKTGDEEGGFAALHP